MLKRTEGGRELVTREATGSASPALSSGPLVQPPCQVNKPNAVFWTLVPASGPGVPPPSSRVPS